tara:strand:- start:5574 stop:6203 length:630 start_codon:yes stop_codon:yes gene_type:complete
MDLNQNKRVLVLFSATVMYLNLIRILFLVTTFTVSNLVIRSATAAEVRSFATVKEHYQLNGTGFICSRTSTQQRRKLLFRAPLDGSNLAISSKFGPRRHPVMKTRKAHMGIDYAVPRGTPIKSTANGKIQFAGRQKGYGKVIKISHIGGFTTVYAHQSRFKPGLKRGSFVMRGETIGYVGSTGTTTGNNLHYEVRVNNKPVDPLMVDKS